MVLITTFISMSITSPVGAQSPEPPEILENGEFPTKLDQIEQALKERNDVALNDGDNNINVVTTWFSSSGITFVPSSSTITYTPGWAGCVDSGTDGQVWHGSVNIPHGSTITSMFFNYRNEEFDPADSLISLYRIKFDGTFDQILSVTGTNNGVGNHTQPTYTVAHNVVDNYNFAYVLVWEGKTQQELCGINLGYTPPPFYLQALPIITR